MRISAIWYPVAQWEAAKHFYTALLGLQLTGCDDEAGWAVFAPPDSPPFFLVRNPELAGQQAGATVTFDCTDLAAFHQRLRQAGVRCKPFVEGNGMRILPFYDPDGNRLEASERVASNR